MKNELPQFIERLADRIGEHLAANPHAADTVAGIRSWWLSATTAAVSCDDVERAVGLLVKRGTVELHTLPDGTRIYGRAEANETGSDSTHMGETSPT